LITKADTALQEYYRRKFPKDRCESCGAKANLRHHFIEKSRSNFLRYAEINLIACCSKCHSLHHSFGDSSVMARVVLKRGQDWFDMIQKLRRNTIKFNEKYLNDIIKFYE